MKEKYSKLECKHLSICNNQRPDYSSQLIVFDICFVINFASMCLCEVYYFTVVILIDVFCRRVEGAVEQTCFVSTVVNAL